MLPTDSSFLPNSKTKIARAEFVLTLAVVCFAETKVSDAQWWI